MSISVRCVWQIITDVKWAECKITGIDHMNKNYTLFEGRRQIFSSQNEIVNADLCFTKHK